MGFMTGVTASSSVLEASRRQVLDLAMDLNCLTWIVSLDLAKLRRLRVDLVVVTPLELGALIGAGIQIELASDTLIFRRPYRYSEMKRDLIRSKTLDLLKTGLVELLHGVQQAKVEAIARITLPTDVSRVCAFMGLANYYRRYVKGFSAIAKPLNQLLKSDQEWQWGDEQERAFVELKARLMAATILRCYLFGTQFTLVTDHQPLKWLMESDKLTGKLARWALILQEYDFQVVHRPGIANLESDVREGVASPPRAGSPTPLEVLAGHGVKAAVEEAARPSARESPRIFVTTEILETKDDTPSKEEEVQSVRGTPTGVLCEQVVPLLRYLDRKATKYGDPRQCGFYVELVRNWTRIKVATNP
ncbi:hypothetical protein AXG93_3515s1040 [Marchantia polymorpha subsp. ruderalis]|uniref:Reverse transcriptase RNase H-like domain-containing protein n=1 Tax=Marchantia polymorpha subsp. ruderalis TaxID=1480154 RepID=A0A176WHA2_MARPO|nr:hypothetical protein AXG93_3515s1040 [Marchantia polymorpha subsp. ruderalis]